MAKIVINRKRSFLNSMKKFDILINDQKVGAVKNGGAEEFTVPAGSHKVQCKISWYRSNVYDVSLQDKDIKFLQVKANMKGIGVLYLILLITLIGPLVFRNASWMNRDVLEWARIAMLGIIILYGLYFSFFARDKYLSLKDDADNIFNT